VSATLGAGLGLFGKIAAEPDFVSIGDDRWSHAQLDIWLQEALAALRSSGRPFPAQSALLLGMGAETIVGAAFPSADAAGRAFPLVVFSELEGGAASAEARAVFALDASPVVRAAAVIASSAAEGAGVAALEARLRDASAIFDEERRLAEARLVELLRAPARPLLDALDDAAAYALTTVRTACREACAAVAAGEAAELLLRCPAPTEDARAFWIVLAGRLLDGVPWSFVHVREPAGAHLELCLGAPPVGLIASATGDETGPGHWSLIPRAADARASARQRLTEAEAAVLSKREPTFADLLRVFAP
jgi:type VI secretion system ImpM family protein